MTMLVFSHRSPSRVVFQSASAMLCMLNLLAIAATTASEVWNENPPRRLQRQGVISLRQSDFEKGTYRIQYPGRYILREDIEFSPRPDNDY